MKRIVVFDHAFHEHTRSSDFFVEVLQTAFDVERRFIPAEPIVDLTPLSVPVDTDAVVLWQLDYLAPIFLSRGIRTVVVPMFDGSGSMPDLHWQASLQARFVSFSLALHLRLRHLGGKSMLVRYFAQVGLRPASGSFRSLRGFLWMRRPRTFNVRLVEKLFGSQLASLHVHDAPDTPERRVAADFQSSLFHTSRTEWFANSAGYREILSHCNVFIAPRDAEGIGHSLLEAMSMGMLIAANDRPTHNEYIANRVNGLLFDLNNPEPLSLEGAESMAMRAWKSARDGRLRWQSSLPRLIQYIKDCERPQVRGFRMDAPMAIDLIEAYYRQPKAYLEILRKVFAESCR